MTISKDNNSELRSEKMQKIIDTHPAFMVRWGNVVIIRTHRWWVIATFSPITIFV